MKSPKAVNPTGRRNAFDTIPTRVYVAGPFAGLSSHEISDYCHEICDGWCQRTCAVNEATNPNWKNIVLEEREFLDNVHFMFPIRGHLESIDNREAYGPKPQFEPHAFAARDFSDIRKCDTVLFWFGQSARISQGMLLELGYAKALGKYCIGWIPKDHPCRHDMVVATLDICLETKEEALDQLFWYTRSDFFGTVHFEYDPDMP